MSTSITLDDGRAVALSNWEYDLIVTAVTVELDKNEKYKEFSNWLLTQTCRLQGPGVGYIDTREISLHYRKNFREACFKVFKKVQLEGPEGWNSRSAFDTYMKSFDRLLKMWESIDLGEPPQTINDMNMPVPFSGEQRGPGWHLTF